jgi:ABC-type lipoprotein export system ATPase subunit
VTIDGMSLAQWGINDWSRTRQKHLAIVFQDLRLFHDLTAWDNVIVKNNLTKHYSEADIAAKASRLGIASLLPKPAGTLSQGEKQRVAILRAVMQPFDLILLDEPFSHLDEGNARAAVRLIEEECKARGAGLMIAQHGGDNWFNYSRRIRL